MTGVVVEEGKVGGRGIMSRNREKYSVFWFSREWNKPFYVLLLICSAKFLCILFVILVMFQLEHLFKLQSMHILGKKWTKWTNLLVYQGDFYNFIWGFKHFQFKNYSQNFKGTLGIVKGPFEGPFCQKWHVSRGQIALNPSIVVYCALAF